MRGDRGLAASGVDCRNSWNHSAASTAKTRTIPASATGASAAANSVYGIRETAPTIMFCGLPVMVAVLPTLEAIATAMRYEIGSRRSGRVTSLTSGVITRHTTSLTRNAEDA